MTTDETTLQPGRELDALIAEKIEKLSPIEWRICRPDPECGVLESIQEFGGDWKEDAPRHPCYNWLDTHEPRESGWTDERIAEAKTEWRDHYWRVVSFYSTDNADAISLFERHTDAEIEKAGGNYHVTLSGWATASAQTLPHAICLAALKAVNA